MAKQTTIRYSCDHCEKPLDGKKDLRRFELTERKMSGEVAGVARTELCADCERELHECALPLFPHEEAEKLLGIVRP